MQLFRRRCDVVHFAVRENVAHVSPRLVSAPNDYFGVVFREAFSQHVSDEARLAGESHDADVDVC